MVLLTNRVIESIFLNMSLIYFLFFYMGHFIQKFSCIFFYFCLKFFSHLVLDYPLKVAFLIFKKLTKNQKKKKKPMGINLWFALQIS